MTSPKKLLRMRRIVRLARSSAKADCIYTSYQHEWGWIDAWPVHILDRCEAAIMEAVA